MEDSAVEFFRESVLQGNFNQLFEPVADSDNSAKSVSIFDRVTADLSKDSR